MANKTYSIKVVGKKPGTIQVGTIGKKSGQPEAGAMTAIQEVGEIPIPNWSNVWGLLKRDKASKVTGEIEFLPWGSDKGNLIAIRFMPNCESISVEFQEQKGLKPRKEDAEIVLKYGINKFDEVLQKNLVLMLKHHTYNGSNTSRDPEKRHIRFTNYEATAIVSTNAGEIIKRQEAERIVLDARHKPENMKVLAIIFELDANEPDDNKTFEKLLSASQNPKYFFEVMHGVASEFKRLLINSQEIELIEINGADNNVILNEGGQKQILMTAVEGSNIDERIEYITDNITKAEYYNALNNLAVSYKNYKELALQ